VVKNTTKKLNKTITDVKQKNIRDSSSLDGIRTIYYTLINTKEFNNNYICGKSSINNLIERRVASLNLDRIISLTLLDESTTNNNH